MADDKSETVTPDRDRINVNEAYELRYRTKERGVTVEQLRSTVQPVGATAKLCVGTSANNA